MTNVNKSLLDLDSLKLEQLNLDFCDGSDIITLNSGSEIRDGDTISINPFDYNTTISLGASLNPVQPNYSNTFANIPSISIQDSNNWGTITGIYSHNQSNGLTVQGNAEFNGNVKIKGKDVLELFEKIEERLAILQPNTELESEWEELKSLGEQYRKLEAHIKEKMVVWDKLKAMPKIDI